MMKRIKRILQVLVAIASACLLFGLLNRWIFIADLICQFRLITGYLTVVGGLVLLSVRSWIWGTGGLLFGITFLTIIWPYACPIDTHTISEETGYKLLSFNVRVGNDQKEKVTSKILAADPDFILLYEIDSDWKVHLLNQLTETWPHYELVAREDAFGIAIFSKRNFDRIEVITFPGAYSTPIISGTVDLDGEDEPVRLIAAHPVPPIDPKHWQARNRLFQNLVKEVASANSARTIVAGDLNCSPWCFWIRRLESKAGLSFASRYRGIQMTWSPFHVVKLGLPIDHVLTGKNIRILDNTLGDFSGSDHRPVMVRFR